MKSVIFEKPLFGDKIKVIIYDFDEEKAKNILEEMYTEALRLQKIFNFFDPKSELSKLNRERQIFASEELLGVLKKSIGISEITKGRYDVSLGKKIMQRKKGVKEKDGEQECSYKDIKTQGSKILLENREVMIDLGSIAKGYMTDKLGDFLKKKGVKEFLIDSRGDILFSGSYNHIIGVQHPRKKGETICYIKISNKGVATSGDYNQYHKSFEKSHIINAGDIISVTVIAKNLEDADLLATAIFVSEKKQIEDIMKNHEDASCFVIKKDLSQEYYNNFMEFIK